MTKDAPMLLVSSHSGNAPSSRPHPTPGKTRSAANKHISSVGRPDPAQDDVSTVEQSLPNTTFRMLLYIDKQRLGRDCVSEQFATHLAEWTIEPLASARELPKDGIRSRPSLIVLNAHSASVSTADVAGEMAMIAEAAPGLPIVIMSDLDDAAEVLQAIRLGARGYLPSNLPLPQAIGAIRFVGEGGTYIPACVLAASSWGQLPSLSGPVDGKGTPIEFSPRQLQVLELLQQGKQNKIIAYELGMCESTVKVHIRHIMRKLNARNRTQVVLLTNSRNNRPAAAFAA